MRKSLFAVEIGARTIRGLDLSARRGSASAEPFSIETDQELLSLDRRALDEALARAPFSRSAAGEAIVVLSKKFFFCRELSLPKATDSELLRMAYYELQKHLSVPVDTVRFVMFPLAVSDDLGRYLVMAVRTESVDAVVSSFYARGIRVTSLIPSALALSQMAAERPNRISVSIFDKTCEAAVLRGDALAGFFSVPSEPLGSDHLHNELDRQFRRIAREPGEPFDVCVVGPEESQRILQSAVQKVQIPYRIPSDVFPDGRVAEFLSVAASVRRAPRRRAIGSLMKSIQLSPPRPYSWRMQVGVLMLAGALWCIVRIAQAYVANRELASEDALRAARKEASAQGQVEQQLDLVSQWTDSRPLRIERLKRMGMLLSDLDISLTEITLLHSRTVQLRGEARLMAHLVEFMERLNQSAAFSGASLESAQQSKSTPESKFEFSVRLQLNTDWKEAP